MERLEEIKLTYYRSGLSAKLNTEDASFYRSVGMDLFRHIDAVEADNARLRAELERVERERDAAVADLQAFVEYPCGVCKHLQDQQFCYKNCQNHDRENHRAWQWRGTEVQP